MFSYLSSLLHRFESAPVRYALLGALLLLTTGIVISGLGRWLRRRRQDQPEGWAAVLIHSMGDVFRVIVGLGVLAALCLSLSYQSKEFSRLRGGKSERNYEAVKTIWGRPHIQNELRVRLVEFATRFLDAEGLELDPDKLKASTQPIGFKKVEEEKVVPGQPVTEANHKLTVTMNYRKKGSAWYPGFDADAVFSYQVRNFSGKPVTAIFDFPMPVEQGLVDHLEVLVDGQKPNAQLVMQDSALHWGLAMTPDQQLQLTIKYHSRGMDYVRFNPGAGRSLGKYHVSMVCKGAKDDSLNYPIGCMTPTQVLPQGEDTTLDWSLENAVTRLDLGVILPGRTQEGYYVGRVLENAPWGLALLLVMILATHLALGQSAPWLPLAVIALSYHLHLLLGANLSDSLGRPLVLGMAVSGVALLVLVAILSCTWMKRFAAIASVIFFSVFAWAYPALRISEYEGLLLNVLYVLLLAFLVALLVARRRARDQGSA